MSSVQLTLEGNIHYNAKCSYCGKPFDKSNLPNRVMYCSEKCRHYALLEQKAAYQRKRRRLARNGVIIISDKEKGCTTYNSNYLSEYRHKDFRREQRAIEREMKRLKLK